MSPSEQTRVRARMAGREDTGTAPGSGVSGRVAAIVAAATAAWIVVTTLIVIRAGYSPLPFWDEWDRWRTYLTYHYTPAWFFLQHNEHRLTVPDVLFAADHLLFDARGWFLLACTFCLQGVAAAMLWRLSRR